MSQEQTDMEHDIPAPVDEDELLLGEGAEYGAALLALYLMLTGGMFFVLARWLSVETMVGAYLWVFTICTGGLLVFWGRDEKLWGTGNHMDSQTGEARSTKASLQEV